MIKQKNISSWFVYSAFICAHIDNSRQRSTSSCSNRSIVTNQEWVCRLSCSKTIKCAYFSSYTSPHEGFCIILSAWLHQHEAKTVPLSRRNYINYTWPLWSAVFPSLFVVSAKNANKAHSLVCFTPIIWRLPCYPHYWGRSVFPEYVYQYCDADMRAAYFGIVVLIIWNLHTLLSTHGLLGMALHWSANYGRSVRSFRRRRNGLFSVDIMIPISRQTFAYAISWAWQGIRIMRHSSQEAVPYLCTVFPEYAHRSNRLRFIALSKGKPLEVADNSRILTSSWWRLSNNYANVQQPHLRKMNFLICESELCFYPEPWFLIIQNSDFYRRNWW